jgi:hypothetical protein
MAWWRWLRDSRGPFFVFPVSGLKWPALEASPGERLVEESAAFLSGHLAEVLSETEPPSPWVWSNLLAHGSEEELRIEQAKDPRDLWEAARAYLAADVLDLAETCGSLSAVQREVLVPLELELASRFDVTQWGPRDWASTVADALNRYRRTLQRSATNETPPPDRRRPSGS